MLNSKVSFPPKHCLPASSGIAIPLVPLFSMQKSPEAVFNQLAAEACDNRFADYKKC